MVIIATRANAKRVTVTLSDDEYVQLKHWAQKHDESINEYLHDCIEHMIRWESADYDLPTAEIRRLNQLVDGINLLSRNVQGLESIVTSGFDSLLGLCRGDNYLLDESNIDE